MAQRAECGTTAEDMERDRQHRPNNNLTAGFTHDVFHVTNGFI